jgi:hypothetical protein
MDPLVTSTAVLIYAPRSSNTRLMRRKSAMSGPDTGMAPGTMAGIASWTSASRSGSGKGSGRSRTALTTLKMAVVAPMPSASVTAATAVKPGERRSRRAP